jgi:serine/threonine protein kinase
MRVKVPDAPAAYTIVLDPIIDACRLWVTAADGTVFGPIGSGEVGTTRETSRSMLALSTLTFTAGGELTVTLQVANFEHARGASGVPPVFGTAAAVESRLGSQRMVDFFYIGLLTIIGLHHIWLFLLRRREKAAIYFAMICLLVGFRAFLLGRYLPIVWPGVPAWIPMKLEYMTLYGGVAAAVLYLEDLFPRDFPRWLVRVVVVQSAVFSLALLLPRIVYSSMVWWFQLLTLACCALGIVLLARAAWRDRDAPPILVLLGLSSLSLATMLDILRERSIVHTRFTAHYGVAAFVLFQSALLALLNQRRATQLEARSREVQRLNEELRRQIASRSRELSQLVMMVARGGGQVVASAGVVIAGYKILAPLGEGAMGTVFRAEREQDGKLVALKVIRGAATPEGLARFAREAEVAASIDHPNVVGILDFGVTEAGVIYLVMELVEGRSLDEERGNFGNLDWALPLLGQLARALAAIHAREVIHRDVKPANLLVSSGRLKLADFGVAQLDSTRSAADPSAGATVPGGVTNEERTAPSNPEYTGAPTLTRAGMLIGSPMYMAPELAGGAHHASAASDMFAFGLIAYELLGGKRPWERPVVTSVLDGSELPEPTPLTTLAPRLDPRLAALIRACMTFSPSQRPSAEKLVAMLEPIAPAPEDQRGTRSE